MRVLVVEDDAASRRRLEALLERCGHDVRCAADGEQALACVRSDAEIGVVVLDWMLPVTPGIEICRRLKEEAEGVPPYVILLTAKSQPGDVLAGLGCGADQYVTKPFDRHDLEARVRLGRRTVDLQRRLATRVIELESALERASELEGLVPICCYCKRIRREDDSWQELESFVRERSGAEFSHGICPPCFETVKEEVLGD